jgi:hydroxyacylglutathione hydrolase
MRFDTTIHDLRILTCVSKLFHENTYLIESLSKKYSYIVDPGDCFDSILELINQLQNKPQAIILTHGHFDHIFSASHLAKELNIPVFIDEKDFKLIRRASVYSLPILKKIIPIPQVQFYEDFSDFPFQIIKTPGHTLGSVCLNFDSVVFTGDTLFYQHIGPTNYPESDFNELVNSVKVLLQLSRSDAIIFSGHGRPWTIQDAQNWFNKIDGLKIPQYLIKNDLSFQAKGFTK